MAAIGFITADAPLHNLRTASTSTGFCWLSGTCWQTTNIKWCLCLRKYGHCRKLRRWMPRETSPLFRTNMNNKWSTSTVPVPFKVSSNETAQRARQWNSPVNDHRLTSLFLSSCSSSKWLCWTLRDLKTWLIALLGWKKVPCFSRFWIAW